MLERLRFHCHSSETWPGPVALVLTGAEALIDDLTQRLKGQAL